MAHTLGSTSLIQFTVLLCTLCGVITAAPVEAEVWRQRLWVEGGLPVVDVWIGRRGPWRFAIDTGAEGSLVSRELARRLDLPVLGALEQHTVAGAGRLLAVRVSDLRVGRDAPAFSALTAGVSDLGAMRRAVPSLDGVLGGDALRDVDYLLDYTAGRLTLARGESLEVPGGDTAALPVRFERDRPIVSWPRTDGSPSLPLVLDTGALSLIVDTREATSLPCRARTTQAVRLETHAGARDVDSCELAVMRAGSVRLIGLRMVMLPWPSALERVDRGLLPASAFGRVYVSRLRKTVTLWPR